MTDKTQILAVRIPNESKDMLETAARTGNMTLRELIERFSDRIHDGSIVVGDRDISTGSSLDTSYFEKRCRSVGMNPQDALDMAIDMIIN